MKEKLSRSIRLAKYIFYKETFIDIKEYFWTFLGSFLGIGLITLLQSGYLPISDNVFLIGSFGASSVLVYGAINSPLAQPRNLLGGHIISATIGVSINLLLSQNILLAAPLAVSLSIVAMQCTKTLHPPGGATALIAVIGSPSVINLGYWYILFPVMSGAAILFLTALITNNLTKSRKYPTKQVSFKKYFRND
ncbi:HPP family protein [Chondrinema litorale]|uniref:HPP family protein n=1 Tax=Chondrinema litorale TaxID=2994555 RepID=UPI0025428415|nr:HPP family protein [Chondrinema litorale]UZR98908.1 HPP family protein [Chondrinema litorale]UZR99591.1 HPP family protein [Chondrinema litorale]